MASAHISYMRRCKCVGKRLGLKKNERCLKRLNSYQTGSVTILVAGFLPIMLLLMGLSIDVGRVLAAKTELYKASDVAARELAEEIDVAKAAESGRQVRLTDDADARRWVEKNLDGMCGARLLDVGVVNNEVYVEVESRAEVPLLFSGFAGRRYVAINVTSIARLKVYATGN